MAYDVIIVGGGFGGLTAAALLSARGVKVCLIEKESSTGGCAGSFEKFGYQFEQGAGLYGSWHPGEIYDRIFDELPVSPPELRPISPAYIVRLPDAIQIALTDDDTAFEADLRAAFPECIDAAINFYRELKTPHAATSERAVARLKCTSERFRRFIDVQLQLLIQGDSESCSYNAAASALMLPRRPMHAIRDGAQGLAESLVDAIRRSGGVVRLNTTALRLAWDTRGEINGVDLLTGERLEASRAVISNLTIWDTFGKLVGTSRTPSDIRTQLKLISSRGAYLLFLGMQEQAAKALPAEHILALTDWQHEERFDPEISQFMFAAAPAWDPRAPAGQRAVTVCTTTDVSEWFTFHQHESEHDERDQAALEFWWAKLHAAMPELGEHVEVIDTMTPRDFYQNTRRRLGMVGGLSPQPEGQSVTHRTPFRNLYMVGDTVAAGVGLAAVAQSALAVADEIAPRIRF